MLEKIKPQITADTQRTIEEFVKIITPYVKEFDNHPQEKKQKSILIDTVYFLFAAHGWAGKMPFKLAECYQIFEIPKEFLKC